MHFHKFLFLRLSILTPIASPHPHEALAVIPAAHTIISPKPRSPDILCWYGTTPPSNKSCTYVFEVIPGSELFNFYVCNKGGKEEILAMLALPYELDNIIDTRQTRLANNISARVVSRPLGHVAEIWYADVFLDEEIAGKQYDGRVVGWSAFDNCVLDNTGDLDKGVLVASNQLPV